MDNKFDKKKESIDEILSDLNGLLNKMPSILDGIKMPEMQPQDYAKPAQAPEPQTPKPEAVKEVTSEPVTPEIKPVPAEPFDADKTVVLESFAGLPEGSLVPGEISFSQEPEPASPEEPASAQPEPALPAEGDSGAAQEPEKLAVQSLGDFMFGEEAEKPAAAEPAKLSGAPLEPPAEEPVRNVADGPSLSISEFTPPPSEAAPEASPAEFPEAYPTEFHEAGLPVMPEPAPDQMVFNPGGEAVRSEEQPQAGISPEETGTENKAEASAFETSRDFGIPDIDALMQMSDGEKPAAEQPAQPLPEAGMLPESVQALEAEKDGLSLPAFDGGSPESFEPAPAQAGEEQPQPAAAAEGETAEAGEPRAEEVAVPQAEAAPAAMEPGDFIIEPESKSETPFEAFTIEPASTDPAPAQEGGDVSHEPVPALQADQDAGETLRLDPAPEPLGDPAPEQQPSEPQGLQFEPFAEPAAEPKLEAGPEAQSGSSAEPEPEPKLEVGQGIQFGSVPEPAPGSGIELAPGIELSVGGPAQTHNPDETLPGVQPSGTPSGDETLVVAPRAEASGEEEKTVIFQASPETTTRAQAKDLPSLSVKQAPEGIPPERLRSLVFLYSPGDEALCATVLAELDAICLKSATKPMFIKRAYVKDCDVDSNANFIHQSVADSGAAGLVCVGAVPQEKVYEIENAFASSGGFFRFYDSSTFTHSSALDLVADLILR